MTHKDIYTKFMIEYDKANVTSSYPSLTEYEVAVVLDKAYNALIAQKVTGNNPRRVGFEQDVKAIEDLSPLIVYKSVYNPQLATAVAKNVVKFTMPEHLYFVSGYLTKTVNYATNKAIGRVKTPRRTELRYTDVASWDMGQYDIFDNYVYNGVLSLLQALDEYGDKWYIPWSAITTYIANVAETDTIKFYYELDPQSACSIGFWSVSDDGVDFDKANGDETIPTYNHVDLNDVDLRLLVADIYYVYEQEDLTKDFYVVVTPDHAYQNDNNTLTIRIGSLVPVPQSDEQDEDFQIGTPMDGLTERTVPITLVTHQIAQQFFSTAYNMPWIKNPVCYIESEKVGNTTQYEDKLYVVYDPFDPPKSNSINIVYIKKPNPFVKTLPNDPNTYISFFDPGTQTDTSAYEFELNDTMAEELISLAVTFALENVESPRLNNKLNMRGLEA